MELTTTDATSAIKKGINTENLDWQVFLPSSVKNPEAVTLEVIPLTGDKVYLVMRNVPSDYTLMVIRATNKTPNSNSLKIDVQEYNDYLRFMSDRVISLFLSFFGTVFFRIPNKASYI